MRPSALSLTGAGLLFALIPAESQAGVVYQNPYDFAADFGDCKFNTACQTASQNVFAAQQFTLFSGAIVQSASYTAADGPQLSAMFHPPSAINWAFYTDGGGFPGALVSSGSASLAAQSSAGLDASGTYMVDTYFFDLPSVSLASGGYFFAIQDVTDSTFHYLGEGEAASGSAQTLDGGLSWTVPYGSVRSPIKSIAVSLFDDPVSVPEPLTLSLFGVGVAGLVAARWRKNKKA